MTFEEIKKQIEIGNLEWKELLTMRALFPKYRQDLRHEVIKRNIPWWMPCKDWIAKRIEKKIN